MIYPISISISISSQYDGRCRLSTMRNLALNLNYAESRLDLLDRYRYRYRSCDREINKLNPSEWYLLSAALERSGTLPLSGNIQSQVNPRCLFCLKALRLEILFCEKMTPKSEPDFTASGFAFFSDLHAKASYF